MEQLEVKNTTGDEIAVMWDGFQVYFKPGQVKSFAEGVARGIANEAEGLQLVQDIVEPEIVAEKPVKVKPAKVVEKPVVSPDVTKEVAEKK